MPAAELRWRQPRQCNTFGQVGLGGDEEAGGLPIHVMALWGKGPRDAQSRSRQGEGAGDHSQPCCPQDAGVGGGLPCRRWCRVQRTGGYCHQTSSRRHHRQHQTQWTAGCLHPPHTAGQRVASGRRRELNSPGHIGTAPPSMHLGSIAGNPLPQHSLSGTSPAR